MDELLSEVDEIIKQIPGWGKRNVIQIQALGGLTNTNYSVVVDGEHFVLRLSGKNTTQLGIKRELEIKSLLAASAAGICPPVVYYKLPEGHLVTRYINGRHLTLEEYRTPGNIQRVVKAVNRLHDLPWVEATFSSFRRVQAYAIQVQDMHIPLPRDYDKMIQKMERIEREQKQDTSHWQRFCHNDLFSVNVLDDGKIWFVDWEFAGVGDIYFDLATLLYAYDSMDTLPRELQEYVLELYFGDVIEECWSRLEGMKYMVMFFNAMWGLLQQGMQNKGLVRAVDGFNFQEYAKETFEAMRRTPV
jgi:thiamine kinase-like enzyme